MSIKSENGHLMILDEELKQISVCNCIIKDTVRVIGNQIEGGVDISSNSVDHKLFSPMDKEK